MKQRIMMSGGRAPSVGVMRQIAVHRFESGEVAVWMQELAQGAGGFRIADEIWKGVSGDELEQALKETLNIPVVEEEAGFAMAHGVGEAADA